MFTHTASRSIRLFSSIRVPLKLKNNIDYIRDIDVFIFDCDGVIWKGENAIFGVQETIENLRKLNKKVYFATNNSTKSRYALKDKLEKLHIKAGYHEVFSSSFAAAVYLEMQNFKNRGKKAYIIGQAGIAEELDLLGIPWIGGPDHANASITLPNQIDIDCDIGAVVVGFDADINYYKIQYAQLCINTLPDCLFIATNLDETANRTLHQQWAAGGAMVGAVKGCTGKTPIVVGKPGPLMIDYILADSKCDRARMVMVGDRLDTDIMFGLNNHLSTILTLSGVTTKEKLFDRSNEIIPHFYVDSIHDFFN